MRPLNHVIASPWNWIKELIDKFANGHHPLLDLDDDGFSISPTFRGYHWRGRDCNDFNAEVYPGRRVFKGNPYADYNCNGIKGEDVETRKPWKSILCDGTGQIGVGVIGDSAGAHFSIPEK